MSAEESFIIYTDASYEQKIISVTQEQISKSLNISITTINNFLKKIIDLNIIEKIKNGKYAILIWYK